MIFEYYARPAPPPIINYYDWFQCINSIILPKTQLVQNNYLMIRTVTCPYWRNSIQMYLHFLKINVWILLNCLSNITNLQVAFSCNCLFVVVVFIFSFFHCFSFLFLFFSFSHIFSNKAFTKTYRSKIPQIHGAERFWR